METIGTISHRGEHVELLSSDNGGKLVFSGADEAIINLPGGLYKFVALNIQNVIEVVEVPREPAKRFTFEPTQENVDPLASLGFGFANRLIVSRTKPKEATLQRLNEGDYFVKASHSCEVSWERIGTG